MGGDPREQTERGEEVRQVSDRCVKGWVTFCRPLQGFLGLFRPMSACLRIVPLENRKARAVLP